MNATLALQRHVVVVVVVVVVAGVVVAVIVVVVVVAVVMATASTMAPWTSSRLRTAPRQDRSRLRCRLLPNAFLLRREDVLLAAGLEVDFPGDQGEGSTQLYVQAAEGRVVRRVPEVAMDVEGLLDAHAIVLHQMPPLVHLRDQSALPNGDHVSAVVDLPAVVPEEVEEELADGLSIRLSITP